MLVLDDGWFGKRDDDYSGLGDWFVNEKKLEGTLAELSSEIHAMGMKFGLWFEPEMVSEDSDLYRAHPDWALQIPGRQPNRGEIPAGTRYEPERGCRLLIQPDQRCAGEGFCGLREVGYEPQCLRFLQQ